MFSLLLTLCTLSSCDSYTIAQDDEWTTQAPCQVILEKESDFLAESWKQSFGGTMKYLARFDIKTYPALLTDYDYTCEKL